MSLRLLTTACGAFCNVNVIDKKKTCRSTWRISQAITEVGSISIVTSSHDVNTGPTPGSLSASPHEYFRCTRAFHSLDQIPSLGRRAWLPSRSDLISAVKLRKLCFGLLQDWQIGVSIFPSIEKCLVSLGALHIVAQKPVSAGAA